MIKILQEKVLNAIYLSWFRYYTSKENDTPNVYSNEPSINW